jgi:septal ring factor EnvC (AmiA/AmiB activator)
MIESDFARYSTSIEQLICYSSLQIRFHNPYIYCFHRVLMDYSYMVPRLSAEIEEMRQRQRKLERYVNYLLEKKAEDLGKLEKRVAEQEKQIEKLKERTELMARDNLRLKEHVNTLTEALEQLANKQKRDTQLETY